MRITGSFLAGVLAGAGAVVVTATLLQRSEPIQATRPAQQTSDHQVRKNRDAATPEPAQAAARQEGVQRSAAAQSPPNESLSASYELAEPKTDAEWNALIGGMLEWEVERRTGEALGPQSRARLVSELGRLREASLELQAAPAQPGSPAEVRDRLTQTLTLVQVDRAFRDELGIGVAEFLQRLDPAAVEDVSAEPVDP